MRKRWIAAVISISAILFILAGVWTQTHHRPTRQLRIALADLPVFLLIHLAEARNFFEAEGLNVHFSRFPTGKDALASVLRDEADVATVFETPIVRHLLEGTDLGVLTSIHLSSRNTAIVARKDRGIRSGADLKGKRIGVAPGTSGEFFLYLFLTNEGIALSEVTIIPRNAKDVGSLFRGNLDAIVTWQPYLYQATQQFPAEQVSVLYSDVYREMSVLAGKRAFLLQRQDLMLPLLRALAKAEQFAGDHPEESIQLLTRRLSGLDEPGVREVWKNTRARLEISNSMVSLFEQEARWFMDAGAYPGPMPDFRHALISQYLETVKPDAVTVPPEDIK